MHFTNCAFVARDQLTIDEFMKGNVTFDACSFHMRTIAEYTSPGVYICHLCGQCSETHEMHITGKCKGNWNKGERGYMVLKKELDHGVRAIRDNSIYLMQKGIYAPGLAVGNLMIENNNIYYDTQPRNWTLVGRIS